MSRIRDQPAGAEAAAVQRVAASSASWLVLDSHSLEPSSWLVNFAAMYIFCKSHTHTHTESSLNSCFSPYF